MYVRQCLPLALFALASLGCAPGNTAQIAPAPHIEQLRLVPAAVVLGSGETVSLAGYIAANATVDGRDLTWWSSDPRVATVDAAGHVHGGEGGIARIVARVVVDPSVAAVAVVGVTGRRGH